MPSFALTTIKKDLLDAISNAHRIIQDVKSELDFTEQVIRVSTRQKEYEETYLKFITEHQPPSTYEAEISCMVKNLFESNRADRDAIYNFWQAKAVALKFKIEDVEQKLAELEHLRVTDKPAK